MVCPEIRSRGRTKPQELPSSCRLEDERKQLPESPDQVYLDVYSVYIIHYSRFTKNLNSLQQMSKWTAILLQPESSWFQSGNFLTVAVVCSVQVEELAAEAVIRVSMFPPGDLMVWLYYCSCDPFSSFYYFIHLELCLGDQLHSNRLVPIPKCSVATD